MTTSDSEGREILTAKDARAITDGLILAHHAKPLARVLAKVRAEADAKGTFVSFSGDELPIELATVLVAQLGYKVRPQGGGYWRVSW